MNIGVFVVIQTLVLFLDVVGVAMSVRALLSWFFMGQTNKVLNFLYVVTEPVILPVRAVCARFGWFQGVPIDMPFLITMLLLIVASLFLQAGLVV